MFQVFFGNSCGGRSRSRIDRCHHPGGSSGSGSSSRSSSSIKMVKAECDLKDGGCATRRSPATHLEVAAAAAAV